DVERAIPSGKHFIGGHPMCGSELSGLEAARADLYKGATWVLTPTETTDSQALADLSGVVSETGAKVLAVRPDEHDRFVGVVSHLPHVVAAALMDFVSRKASSEAALAKLAAGGLRDVTRIAAGSPEIWTDILTWNGEAVVEALEELQKRLGEVKEWLAWSDAVRLKTFLLEARAARNEFFVKREAKGAFWEVAVAIEDRPGALAQVTTLVGQRGINISDVTITHPVEAGSGGAGLLRLTIEGEDEAIAAGQAL
ncbi:MAG: prephenate dehydrogenase/arogenate dehydrogenase family protein, partial [Acidimicrobiia bacterium]